MLRLLLIADIFFCPFVFMRGKVMNCFSSKTIKFIIYLKILHNMSFNSTCLLLEIKVQLNSELLCFIDACNVIHGQEASGVTGVMLFIC